MTIFHPAKVMRLYLAHVTSFLSVFYSLQCDLGGQNVDRSTESKAQSLLQRSPDNYITGVRVRDVLSVILTIRKADCDIMDQKTISISARVCTEAETKALSLWSVSFLPLCRIWAARRGLRPPDVVVEALQKMSFEATAIPKTMLEPLITVPSNNRLNVSDVEYDSKLEGITTDLSYDLQLFQVSVSCAGLHDREQVFLTASRDLRRFQAAISQLQLTQIEIVTGEPIIVTLFSPQRMTLYIPLWLIDVLPRTMFEPNQSFYRARLASLAWLLLDAIVVTTTEEFKTVYEYYEA